MEISCCDRRNPQDSYEDSIETISLASQNDFGIIAPLQPPLLSDSSSVDSRAQHDLSRRFESPHDTVSQDQINSAKLGEEDDAHSFLVRQDFLDVIDEVIEAYMLLHSLDAGAEPRMRNALATYTLDVGTSQEERAYGPPNPTTGRYLSMTPKMYRRLIRSYAMHIQQEVKTMDHVSLYPRHTVFVLHIVASGVLWCTQETFLQSLALRDTTWAERELRDLGVQPCGKSHPWFPRLQIICRDVIKEFANLISHDNEEFTSYALAQILYDSNRASQKFFSEAADIEEDKMTTSDQPGDVEAAADDGCRKHQFMPVHKTHSHTWRLLMNTDAM